MRFLVLYFGMFSTTTRRKRQCPILTERIAQNQTQETAFLVQSVLKMRPLTVAVSCHGLRGVQDNVEEEGRMGGEGWGENESPAAHLRRRFLGEGEGGGVQLVGG
eukprot:1317558-Rhodomonas_salina.1